MKFVDECYLSHVNDSNSNDQKEELVHLTSLTTNLTSNDVEYTDPRCYADSLNPKDSDSPSYHEAIYGPHSEEYIQAMKTEVSQLVLQNTWKRIPRCKVNPKN